MSLSSAPTDSLFVAVFQRDPDPARPGNSASAFGLGRTQDEAVRALVLACREAQWNWVHVGSVRPGEGFDSVPRRGERVLARH